MSCATATRSFRPCSDEIDTRASARSTSSRSSTGKARSAASSRARLAARARAGVRVRVLLDAWGAKPIERSLVTTMEEAGVLVRWFRPLRRFRPNELNHRTHRKVLIVDEAIGFAGGVGIADEWLGDARNATEWRDTHFRRPGPRRRRTPSRVSRQLGRDRPRTLRRGHRSLPRSTPGRDRHRAVRAGCIGDRSQRRLHAVPCALPGRAAPASHHDRVFRARRRDHRPSVRRSRPRRRGRAPRSRAARRQAVRAARR